MYFAFFLSWMINLGLYFFADKLVISLSGGKTLNQTASQEIYAIIKELCSKMVLPMPKILVTPEMQANVFAVGRGPATASIVLTRGIINSLSRQEMMAVL